jgi:hypothetical protein
LRQRGRVADQLARKHGYDGGYKVISLIEMDYAKDEMAFLEKVLFGNKQ